jgi:hypothetical protein
VAPAEHPLCASLGRTNHRHRARPAGAGSGGPPPPNRAAAEARGGATPRRGPRLLHAGRGSRLRHRTRPPPRAGAGARRDVALAGSSGPTDSAARRGTPGRHSCRQKDGWPDCFASAGPGSGPGRRWWESAPESWPPGETAEDAMYREAVNRGRRTGPAGGRSGGLHRHRGVGPAAWTQAVVGAASVPWPPGELAVDAVVSRVTRQDCA